MPDARVLIEYEVGLAYCRPYYSEYEATRQVLRYLNDEEIPIDIRLACWQLLNSAISAELTLLNYLLDEATKLLTNLDPDEALAEYQSNILTESNLYENGTSGIRFDDDLAPEVEDLQAAIEEMGLEDFRLYAHDLLEICPKAQSELDLMIRERYEPTAQDPGIFEANVASIIETQRQIEVLIDAYIWSSDAGKYFMASEESVIYTRRSDLLRGVDEDRLKIICPSDIQAQIT